MPLLLKSSMIFRSRGQSKRTLDACLFDTFDRFYFWKESKLIDIQALPTTIDKSNIGETLQF